MLYTVSLALYALNTLNYPDSVRQDGRVIRSRMERGGHPINCRWVYGIGCKAVLLGTTLKGIARNATGKGPGPCRHTLREAPRQNSEQEI